MITTKSTSILRMERLLKRVTKHGPYALPIGFLLCIISFYVDGPKNLWFLYLPPFIFYSLAYIFGRKSTNEAVITGQIMISLTFMPLIFYLYLVAILTKFPLHFMLLTSNFVLALTYIYIFALYFALAKQALKDASSKETDHLWKRNLYRAVLGLIGDGLMLPIAALLLSGFPVDGKDIYEKRNFLYTYLAVCSVIKALFNCGFFIILLCCYSTRKSFDAKAQKLIFFTDVNDNGCGQKNNDTVADVHQWWNKCNLFEAKHARIQPEKLILPL